MMNTEIGRETHSIFIRTFLEEMVPSMTADMDIQSPNRWTLKDQQEYLESVLYNAAVSLFVIAQLMACKSTCHDKEDVQYYERWCNTSVKTTCRICKGAKKVKGVKDKTQSCVACDAKGYTKTEAEFLNLDSWNRTNTLKLFYEGKITFPKGVYNLNGSRYVVDKTNNTYDTMDPNLRMVFDSRKLTIEMITKATRRDLSEIFLRVNASVPLNAAELRNASLTLVAAINRKLGANYTESFPNVEKMKHNNRRDIDDFFAGLFSVFALDDFKNDETSVNITTGVLRELYENDSYGSFVPQFEKFVTKFMKELLSFPNFPTIIHKNFILDLFTILRFVDRKPLMKMKDYQDFFSDAYDAYVKLIADKKTKHEYTKGRFAVYSELMRSRQRKMNVIRQGLIMEMIKPLESYCVEHHPNRLASKETKLLVWNRDKGMTPEGVKIEPKDLYDTTVAQGGHVIMDKNGGSAEPENIVIQTRKDNLSLKTDLPAELIPESIRAKV